MQATHGMDDVYHVVRPDATRCFIYCPLTLGRLPTGPRIGLVLSSTSIIVQQERLLANMYLSAGQNHV